MSFWRDEIIDFALSRETEAHIGEQTEWISREPANPRPWYNLAQLYRLELKQDEALGLLLEAVSRDDTFAPAHVSLVEIYAVRHDYAAAWRHARKAEQYGDARGVELLHRYRVAE
jgi:tetratricopeptide (TPR) repeat protein